MWCAPEVIDDYSKISAASDVYSLAIILYEIMCQRDPFSIGYQASDMQLKGNKPNDMILKCIQMKVSYGLSFVELTKDIVQNGRRPDMVLISCEDVFKNTLLLCWQTKPKKRPSISAAIETLNLFNKSAQELV